MMQRSEQPPVQVVKNPHANWHLTNCEQLSPHSCSRKNHWAWNSFETPLFCLPNPVQKVESNTMHNISNFIAIAFFLYAVSVLAAVEDFPLKRVPQLTSLG
jgi:hypothetical protein